MTGKGFVVLVIVAVLIGVVLFAMIQCGAHQNGPRFNMQTVTLPDGTKVPCLFYHEGGGDTSVAGMDCDWSEAIRP